MFFIYSSYLIIYLNFTTKHYNNNTNLISYLLLNIVNTTLFHLLFNYLCRTRLIETNFKQSRYLDLIFIVTFNF